MPLRREVSQLDRPARRDEAMATFGLDPQWPTLLVTGGSLGAQRLNTTFASRAGELSAAGLQVLHVTGAGKEFTPDLPAVGAPYVVVPYADRMELAYAAADLVVCRSGANTAAAHGRGPACGLRAAADRQRRAAAQRGGGRGRRGRRPRGGRAVHPRVGHPATLPLAADGARLDAMADAAASVGQRDADDALASLVHEAYAAFGAVRADGR